jgi:hypothetical protein
MFDTLCDLVPRDNAYPNRVRKLAILNRALDGTIYDILPYHFHEERNEAGEYIPLRQRRPSVRSALSVVAGQRVPAVQRRPLPNDRKS